MKILYLVTVVALLVFDSANFAFGQNYRDGGGGQKIHDPSLVDFHYKGCKNKLARICAKRTINPDCRINQIA
jgi:hypothetical protein